MADGNTPLGPPSAILPSGALVSGLPKPAHSTDVRRRWNLALRCRVSGCYFEWGRVAAQGLQAGRMLKNGS